MVLRFADQRARGLHARLEVQLSYPLIIVGRGLSADHFKWPLDIPIMAVSGGYEKCPTLHHFVGMDQECCFPNWLVHGTRFEKHVPNNKYAPFWERHPCVRVWPLVLDDGPDFAGDNDAPIVTGPLARNYSLFMAVQIAPRLGFRTLIFIGCDLMDNDLQPVAAVMREWYPLAKAENCEWFSASDISVMNDFMPRWERKPELAAA